MSYINIYDVLPKEIVEQIQEYVDGVKVYIPKKQIAVNHGEPTRTLSNWYLRVTTK
ncbi:hypothetical protein [Clostridium sp. UBA4548]|uniref:hypothetical protein n=1 Tax=Clostridium sp. UBA4548 TaxID=1946361 RepID=UPI0032E52F55